MSTAALRRDILRQTKQHRLDLDTQALAALVQALEVFKEPSARQTVLAELIKRLLAEPSPPSPGAAIQAHSSDRTISGAIAAAVIQRFGLGEQHGAEGGAPAAASASGRVVVSMAGVGFSAAVSLTKTPQGGETIVACPSEPPQCCLCDELRIGQSRVGRAPHNRIDVLRQRYFQVYYRALRSGLFTSSGLTSTPNSVNNSLSFIDGRGGKLIKLSTCEGLPRTTVVVVVGLLQRQIVVDTTGKKSQVPAPVTDDPDQTAEDPSTSLMENSENARWVLEDPDRVIPVNITSAVVPGGVGLIAAGTVVMCRGTWTGAIFQASAIFYPPATAPPTLMSGSSSNSLMQSYDGTQTQARADPSLHCGSGGIAQDSVIIFAAHLHLNYPPTMQRLAALFSTFENLHADRNIRLSEVTFVLVGDFSSVPVLLSDPSALHAADQNDLSSAKPTVSGPFLTFEQYTLNFEAFANMLRQHAPTVAAMSQFVLVPGPNDLTCSSPAAIPQLPILSTAVVSLKQRCQRLVLAMNPCRLQWAVPVTPSLHTDDDSPSPSQGDAQATVLRELVLCRADFHKAWRVAAAIHPPSPAQKMDLRSIAPLPDEDEDDVLIIDKIRQKEERAEAMKERQFLEVVAVDQKTAIKSSGEYIESAQAFDHLAKSVCTSGVLLPCLDAAGSATFSHTQTQTNWSLAHCLQITSPLADPSNTPLPAFCVLCDATEQWECQFGGYCRLLNPGSLADTGTFIWFTPADGTVTVNQL